MNINIFGNSSELYSEREIINDQTSLTPKISWSNPIWSFDCGDDANHIELSSDGEYIAASSGNLYFFHKSNPTPLWVHAGLIGGEMDMSHDGSYIVGCGGVGNWWLYLFNKSGSWWRFNAEAYVLSTAISGDGNYIVAGTSDNRTLLFHKSSNIPLWTYSGSAIPKRVDISYDGKSIVAGCSDHKLYYFNKSSSTPIWTSSSFGDTIYDLSISNNGKYIVLGNENTNVYLFENSSSSYLWTYHTPSPVYRVEISDDGKHIVAAGGEILYLFHRSSSTPLWSYHTGDLVFAIEISTDGNYIAAGNLHNELYLFNVSNPLPIWIYFAPIDLLSTNYWNSLSLSYYGNYLGAANENNNIFFFNVFSLSPFTLTSNATSPDRDGNFYLNWSKSKSVDNYSVYTHNSYITQINKSVTLLQAGLNSLNYKISGLMEGIYYYKIVAFNNYGNVSSNCISIEVQYPPEPPEPNGEGNTISGYSVFIIFGLSFIAIIHFVHNFRKKK